MKPKHGKIIEATVACDFCHVALEEGLDVLNDRIRDYGVRTLGIKYLYVGIECDLLTIINLSRAYSLRPSFKKDYSDCEWSIHALDLDNNYSHIVYWSPGA